MKKIFIFLLTISLLLVSCKKAETPEDTIPTTETVSTQNDVIEMKQRPLVAVSLPTNRDTEVAEDGTVIFNTETQHIKLTMADSEVAEKISLDFFNRIDKFNIHAEELRQRAISEYADTDSEAPKYFPYEHGIRYVPERIDQGILSLFGTEITYVGGVHPDYHCVSVNYDLITGEVLTLGSILTHENALPSLKALLLSELNKMHAEQNNLFEDYYKDTINRRFEGEESFDEDWFFTTTGLCFYFSPYEIGPYASGAIIAEITYDRLTGIIADDFFPAERETASGNIYVTAYEDADLSGVTEIAEFILDPNGEKYILQTDQGVQDLYISLNNNRIFAMQQLTKADAVEVQVSPEDAEQLTILYTSNNTAIGKLFIE